MKFYKIKVIFTYLLITSSILIYISSQTQLYRYYMENEIIKTQIKELKDENDQIMIKINLQNSRQSIIEDNPELEIRDNVFYLEEYE